MPFEFSLSFAAIFAKRPPFIQFTGLVRRCFSASGLLQMPHPHVGGFPAGTGRTFAASRCARGNLLKLSMPSPPFFAAEAVLSSMRLDLVAELARADSS